MSFNTLVQLIDLSQKLTCVSDSDCLALSSVQQTCSEVPLGVQQKLGKAVNADSEVHSLCFF